MAHGCGAAAHARTNPGTLCIQSAHILGCYLSAKISATEHAFACTSRATDNLTRPSLAAPIASLQRRRQQPASEQRAILIGRRQRSSPPVCQGLCAGMLRRSVLALTNVLLCECSLAFSLSFSISALVCGEPIDQITCQRSNGGRIHINTPFWPTY